MSIQIEDTTGECLPVVNLYQQRPIRMIVADALRLFRESVAGLLNTEALFRVVGIASTGLEAIALSRELHPDIVLIDIHMPGVDGIEALRQIKAELPNTRVILLTAFVADGSIFAGFAAGASGYLLKDTSTLGLTSAIRAVYAGEYVTAPNIARRMLTLLDRQEACQSDEADDGLTLRERELIMLIGRGMIAKEMAHYLAISEKTVRNHISSIYRKLGMYDRSQIAIYAMRQGLVKL